MKYILTCTDGSVYAPSIYDHTAWAAKRLDASVHVLHMLNPHRERADRVDLSGHIGPDTGSDLLKELVDLEETKNRFAREQGRLIIEDAHRHLSAAGVMEITSEQQHGELVESVTRMESRADLVVIGKRGASADFASLHLGSKLECVIRASIGPVLVASRQFRPIERVLMAYDGGPSVEKAIQFAINQPLLKDLDCHLLRAGRIDADAKWYLEEAAKKLRAAGIAVTVRAESGAPEHVISQFLAENPMDLIVMGAYGHSRIRQLLIGSTTTEVIRTCKVPVLMFR